MTFSSAGIAEYEIDRRDPQGWRHVMQAEAATAQLICLEALKDFGLWEMAYRFFGRLYQWLGELYVDEMAGWAAASGQTFGRLATVNCSYEFSHFSALPFMRRFAMGCSAGLARGSDGVPVHVRTLDWPNQAMGRATRKFWLKMPAHRAVLVSFPGMVGGLSGMVPGAYSVTIDWAPPTRFPAFDFGPLFLLRDVLETCPTYASARARLSCERLSSSVFFTLCGTREACIIERTHRQAGVRELGAEPITVSNHFQCPEFQKYNGPVLQGTEDELLKTTCERSAALREELAALRGTASTELPAFLHALAREPVTNGQTVQRMAFCPAHESSAVERRVE